MGAEEGKQAGELAGTVGAFSSSQEQVILP